MKKFIITVSALLLALPLIKAQKIEEKDHEKIVIHLGTDDDVAPVIYVDGKMFDFPIELLDKDQIESVNVLKGEKAIKEYHSKNGVVLVTTKLSNVNLDNDEVEDTNDKNPMVIIDGKESNHDMFKKLSPDDIESVSVVKGEEAMKKYKAANGVVIVKTKKGNKN